LEGQSDSIYGVENREAQRISNKLLSFNLFEALQRVLLYKDGGFGQKANRPGKW